MGAAKVAIQDIADFQQTRALEMGVDAFVVDPADPVGSAERALGGKADIVFECVGIPGLIAQAVEQVRARGTILMGLANKFGWVALATGNKSELSVGYSTLYGDMVGGFAPIKDLYKTHVYELARWRNRMRQVIPAESIEKPPSAELRPGQLDSDALPPYDLLDRVLRDLVERDRSVDEIVERGVPRDVAERVARMLDAAEYKRRQGPVGIRVTPKAFGKDRRMPITNRFRG
jgi:NAD+ synthase (glutamine-hydrolysing)